MVLGLVTAGLIAAGTVLGVSDSPHPGGADAVAHAPPVQDAIAAPQDPTTSSTPNGVGVAWVVAENRQHGTTAWQITGKQSATGIMGFADHVDAVRGDSVTVRVSTTAPSFHVDAYRMGYYQGLGARLVWSSADTPGETQPSCKVTFGINMVQCSWLPSVQFGISAAWVPGEYLLKLVGADGEQSYVPLTVWDPASHAAYVVMDGVLTDQVFNAFGGYSLYQSASGCAPHQYPCSGRSRVVSFDRPYANSDDNGAGGYLGLTYPLTRFVEEEGLDVAYWTDITLAEHGDLLTNHHMLMSPGHDEEWSQSMRTATVKATRAGVNVAFFGASAVLRKVRLQPSPLGLDRQVVNYRQPTADPLYGIDNAEVSENDWAQAPANQPASTLVGASYIGYDHTSVKALVVSDPSAWLFAGSGLITGARIPGVVAGDMQAYDRTAGNNPPDVVILAHSPVNIVDRPERRYADTTYYTITSSHAGVFDSGTIGWIPSLADCPASVKECPAPMMRALTANLLRIMGSGPSGDLYPSVANWRKIAS